MMLPLLSLVALVTTTGAAAVVGRRPQGGSSYSTVGPGKFTIDAFYAAGVPSSTVSNIDFNVTGTGTNDMQRIIVPIACHGSTASGPGLPIGASGQCPPNPNGQTKNFIDWSLNANEQGYYLQIAHIFHLMDSQGQDTEVVDQYYHNISSAAVVHHGSYDSISLPDFEIPFPEQTVN